ncbi:hypothetical protein J437_LFUL009153 [Ladona fulva]|uniref:Uncharacterized protein n=1 Tax=Ladona fulva TaxID=123851 RepID=A0A8K0KI37_LADFU|nr:hypothetical protein J437_LFUL009153 [Ladona fulva]
MIENIQPETSKTTMRKMFTIPKLVAALIRCLLTNIQALGYNTDEFPINVETVHWDGKLLPAVDSRMLKEEDLPTIILYVNKEQLIDLPRLESSSGSGQAQAVWNAIVDWNLKDKGQIFCCDTTASNTCYINGTCVLLEQKLNRNMLIFAYRHHAYELVLKSVLEVNISQVTTNPDVPLFKKFRDNCKSVDPDKIQCYKENLALLLTVAEIDNLLVLYRT